MAKQWTVMVYMAAGDDSGLDDHAVSDLQEMERAGGGERVNVVVQINRFWPAKPQRYEILKGNAKLVRADVVKNDPRDVEEEAKAAGTVPPQGLETGDANMGDRDTLARFMKWAARDYPANRYLLVLWGHAYGLGFGRDHGDPMTLLELAGAIGEFRTATGRNLDLLGANTCAISYAEAAFELSPCVDYLVASQIAVPFAGWPYDSILREIGQHDDPKDVGKLVVDRYVTHLGAPPTRQQVAMTLLHLRQAGHLPAKIKALADALHEVVSGKDVGGSTSSAGHRLVQVRNAFLATTAGDVRPLIDLFDLCDELLYVAHDLAAIEWAGGAAPSSLTRLTDAAIAMREYLTPELTQKVGESGESEDFKLQLEEKRASAPKTRGAAASVAQAFLGMIGLSIFRTAPSMIADGASLAGTEPVGPFIVFHKRHSGLNGLHGLGIYAPVVTNDANLKRLGLIDEKTKGQPDGKSRGPYKQLALVKDTAWDTLVFDDLRVGLPAAVISGIEDSGATTDPDRAAVTQMLASVDALFTTIDRRLMAARSTSLLGAVPAVPPLRAMPAQPAQRMQAAQPPTLLGSLGRLRLMPRADVSALLEAASDKNVDALRQPRPVAAASGIAPPNDEPHRVDAVISSLASLEKMLTDMERAVLRTLTHGTFGLGPSRLAIDLGKRDMGKRDMGKRDMGKRDMGKRDMGKRDMGAPDDGKRDMGPPDIGIFVGSGASQESTAPAVIMAALFAQVGTALQGLEEAVSDLEFAAARVLLGRKDKGPLGAADAVAQDRDDLERAFRIAFEASSDASRTLRHVLSDPAYGFGRGAAGVSTEDRSELARLAGLNSLDLRLL